MSTAAATGNISTSSRIKALGLPASDTRKALRILALSEAIISLMFTKSEPTAGAKPTSKIKPILKAQ